MKVLCFFYATKESLLKFSPECENAPTDLFRYCFQFCLFGFENLFCRRVKPAENLPPVWNCAPTPQKAIYGINFAYTAAPPHPTASAPFFLSEFSALLVHHFLGTYFDADADHGDNDDDGVRKPELKLKLNLSETFTFISPRPLFSPLFNWNWICPKHFSFYSLKPILCPILSNSNIWIDEALKPMFSRWSSFFVLQWIQHKSQ